MSKNRETYLQIVESQKLIDGRFDQVQRIDTMGGRGHFSLVFRARDTLNGGQAVVLKFYNPDFLTEPYRYESFQREADLLSRFRGKRDIICQVGPRASFSHQFVAAALTLNIEFHFYSVELAETDVKERILTGTWPASAIFDSFRAMCRAVQRLHVAGIVHRDLKPDNFLLLANGATCLADFGTARDLQAGVPLLNHYAFPVGDKRYASPEVVALLHDGNPSVSVEADIFSLGCILFEMVTGAVFTQQIFDKGFYDDLAVHLVNVPKKNRAEIFHAVIPSIANSRPLPDLRSYPSSVPLGVIDRLNDLYQGLACLDYRARLKDFRRIFLILDTCNLILRHEARIQEWRKGKLKRKVF